MQINHNAIEFNHVGVFCIYNLLINNYLITNPASSSSP